MRLKFRIQLVLIRILVLTLRFRPGVSKPLEPFGYINVDCGGTGGKDPITGLDWESDDDYLQSAALLKSEGLAVSSKVIFSNSTAKFRVNANQLDTATVLWFPQSTQSKGFSKYCYSFDVSLSNMQSRDYLVRVVFSNTNLPSVDWELEYSQNFLFAVDTKVISDITLDNQEAQTVELFATALDDSLDICLLENKYDYIPGPTLVGISSIEVRSLPETLYPAYKGGKLDSKGRTLRLNHTVYYYVTVSRLNFGGDESSPPIRYPPIDTTVYGTGPLLRTVRGIVLTSAWEGATHNATISFTLDMVWWVSRAAQERSSLYYCLNLGLFDVAADKNNSGSRSVDIKNTDSTGASQWIGRDAKVQDNGTYVWTDRTYDFDGGFEKALSTFNIRPAAESTLPAMCWRYPALSYLHLH
ncbi:hypothetical protein R1sor_003572 [Riccia sorocarpa]|uniref:Malectin-like domain-containing protein n=1 Tax=Riccia sorocarpa TaxID=122646 RepID=A0ABD3H5F5_9MARC